MMRQNAVFPMKCQLQKIQLYQSQSYIILPHFLISEVWSGNMLNEQFNPAGSVVMAGH
jgi:hypothetical protein